MERVARIAAHLSPAGNSQGEGSTQLQLSPTSADISDKFKVAVLGASGGIGQPLALLLKLLPAVRELSLYDVVNTPGVGCDLSHIDTATKVSAFVGAEQLSAALYGCDLVLIPAGIPRKPGMTRDDLFNINAGIVRTLCEGIAKYCPKAWVAIISNPVNSTVPIAAEVFKRAGTYNPRKLLGVTKLDVVRARAFVAELAGADPADVSVPVVGGHAGATILPLLSQARPRVDLPRERLQALMTRIQNAGTEVVDAKKGAGSATLSMAYAAAKFGEACLAAMAGALGVEECAYVDSPLVAGVPFFASRLRLGRDGVQEILPLGPLSDVEEEALAAMKPELVASIQKGTDFVAKGPAQGNTSRSANPNGGTASSSGPGSARPQASSPPPQPHNKLASDLPQSAGETTGIYYGGPDVRAPGGSASTAHTAQHSGTRSSGSGGQAAQHNKQNLDLPQAATDTTGTYYGGQRKPQGR